MTYTDENFPEFALARSTDGTCRVCEVPAGCGHDVRSHEAWEAAEEATWD